MVVVDTCSISALVYDPSFDDAPASVQTEIQLVLPIVHDLDLVMFFGSAG